jgi:hypothetical protein
MGMKKSMILRFNFIISEMIRPLVPKGQIGFGNFYLFENCEKMREIGQTTAQNQKHKKRKASKT